MGEREGRKWQEEDGGKKEKRKRKKQKRKSRIVINIAEDRVREERGKDEERRCRTSNFVKIYLIL